jgi:hypothetical protein
MNGADLSLENDPNYLLNAINFGFSCELDFWVIKNKLYLGHDEPIYKINMEFLYSYSKKLWIHCKNLDSLNFLLSNSKKLNGFWHQSDDFAITTWGYVWTFPGKPTNQKSILVHLGKSDRKLINVAGVCSDYISSFLAEK